MKLFGVAMSPYVQRPLMVARLKGHELELAAPPGGSLTSPEFLAISPTGKIPALEIAPGRSICESDAICAYLDETLEGATVLAGDALARAHARQIAGIAHNELGNGILPVIVHDLYRMGGTAEEATAGRARIERGLDAIERSRDPGHAYAAGTEPGWADAMLAPMLVFVALIDRAGIGAPLLAARPGQAAYLDRARRHPVVGRSIEEMDAVLSLPPAA